LENVTDMQRDRPILASRFLDHDLVRSMVAYLLPSPGRSTACNCCPITWCFGRWRDNYDEINTTICRERPFQVDKSQLRPKAESLPSGLGLLFNAPSLRLLNVARPARHPWLCLPCLSRCCQTHHSAYTGRWVSPKILGLSDYNRRDCNQAPLSAYSVLTCFSVYRPSTRIMTLVDAISKLIATLSWCAHRVGDVHRARRCELDTAATAVVATRRERKPRKHCRRYAP
jgi:hypothetical protein